MQQPLISSQDKKDLDKFTKFLCLKAAQVIVQGRLGKSISSHCSPLPTGAEWFNLAIKDYPEIQKEAKSALVEGNPDIDSSFVIEISLRTSDSESLTLEVWSLSIAKKFKDVRIHHTVYNRMSLLLKSLMCVSRATPAYKLSRKQGSEYVICFRVYMGKVDISGLGEGFKTLRVGSIGTPTGTLMLSTAFRTAENLHVSTKKLAPGRGNPMKVSPDHFHSPKTSSKSPARPCYTLQSRIMNSRGGSSSSNEPLESPSYGMLPTSFSTSPSDVHLDTSRYRRSIDRGAMFTVGTPPSAGSLGRTSSHIATSSHTGSFIRGPGDATSHRGNIIKKISSIQSQSEQKFSAPVQYRVSNLHKRRTLEEEIVHTQSEKLSPKSIPAGCTTSNHSLTSTLKNEDSVFKPIAESPKNDKSVSTSTTSNSADKTMLRSRPETIAFNSKHRLLSNDSVTTLKSNSPTNARVGFPDNTETTSHLAHVPPSFNSSATVTSQVSSIQKMDLEPLSMPITGAFVSNSKTAARAFSTLSGIYDGQKLPFEDLITDDDKAQRRRKTKGKNTNSSSDTSPESGREDRSTITRSESSLSSHHSSDQSPQRDNPLTDEFVMIDLNPAFGINESTGDLGTFFRICDNPPDLVMFQENNGQESQEALLDLSKHLEDYEKDADDFDKFCEEVQSMS